MTHRKPPAPQRVFTATIAPAGKAAPRRIAAALTASSLFACAGDPEPRAEAMLPVGHEEVLHVAEVNGQKFEFRTLAADADSTPMQFIESSLHRGSRELVGVLFEHYGPLTMLEVFTALAPFDSAPLAVVQSHAAEAKALGRESDDVRAVNLAWLDAAEELVQAPPTALIEKDFPPGAQDECLLTVFFDQGQINWTEQDIVNQSGNPGLPAGGMCVGGRSDFFFEPGLNFCSEFFSNVRTRVGRARWLDRVHRSPSVRSAFLGRRVEEWLFSEWVWRARSPVGSKRSSPFFIAPLRRAAPLVGESRSPRRVSTNVEEVPNAEMPIWPDLGHEALVHNPAMASHHTPKASPASGGCRRTP